MGGNCFFFTKAMENNLLLSSFQVGLLKPLPSRGVGKFTVIWFHNVHSLSFMILLGFMFNFSSFAIQASLTVWPLNCERAYNLGYLSERGPS